MSVERVRRKDPKVGYGTVYPLLTRMRRLGLIAIDSMAHPAR